MCASTCLKGYVRSESNSFNLCLQKQPTSIFGERFECEHACWDPKDGELYLRRVKPGETLVEARSDTDVQIVRHTWTQGRKTNRTIQQLVPFEVSLRIAGVKQLYQVKRMIRGFGGASFSTYSQTLNGYVVGITSLDFYLQCEHLVGLFW